jgi:hypothetical protein
LVPAGKYLLVGGDFSHRALPLGNGQGRDRKLCLEDHSCLHTSKQNRDSVRGLCGGQGDEAMGRSGRVQGETNREVSGRPKRGSCDRKDLVMGGWV